MASIQKRPLNVTRPWAVRYRGPDGHQRQTAFRLKSEARSEAARMSLQEDRWRRGLDLPAEHATVSELGPQWLMRYDREAHTRLKRESALRTWVYPALGERVVRTLTVQDVDALVSTMRAAGKSRALVYLVWSTLALMLDCAQKLGYATENVARLHGSTPQGAPAKDIDPFTEGELIQLVEVLPDEHWLMVLFAAREGLRWGELMGLHSNHVDLRKRAVVVSKALKGDGVVRGTKSGRSRLLPLAESLVNPLGERISARGPGLVFGPIQEDNFRKRVWRPALLATGLGCRTFHSLRHTAASRLIARGASVKAVQEFLGHASARTTLDTYIHLFPGELEGLGQLLD